MIWINWWNVIVVFPKLLSHPPSATKALVLCYPLFVTYVCAFFFPDDVFL
jgi:hypothetical protein